MLPFTPQGSPSNAATFFANLRRFLANFDFTLASFDPVAAAQAFINSVLIPTNLLAPFSLVQQMITQLQALVDESIPAEAYRGDVGEEVPFGYDSATDEGRSRRPTTAKA